MVGWFSDVCFDSGKAPLRHLKHTDFLISDDTMIYRELANYAISNYMMLRLLKLFLKDDFLEAVGSLMP